MSYNQTRSGSTRNLALMIDESTRDRTFDVRFDVRTLVMTEGRSVRFVVQMLVHAYVQCGNTHL